MISKQKCSVCKNPNTVQTIVVRSAKPEVDCVLLAYLCPACEEERQKYLEKKTGYCRNDIVETDNGSGIKVKKEIISLFSEEYFVCDNGYCVAFSFITDGGIQKTLF